MANLWNRPLYPNSPFKFSVVFFMQLTKSETFSRGPKFCLEKKQLESWNFHTQPFIGWDPVPVSLFHQQGMKRVPRVPTPVLDGRVVIMENWMDWWIRIPLVQWWEGDLLCSFILNLVQVQPLNKSIPPQCRHNYRSRDLLHDLFQTNTKTHVFEKNSLFDKQTNFEIGFVPFNRVSDWWQEYVGTQNV